MLWFWVFCFYLQTLLYVFINLLLISLYNCI
jgi:hypothetical protein